MPPPVPVDSTIGVLKFVDFQNTCDAKLENGKTVDDPTMRI